MISWSTSLNSVTTMIWTSATTKATSRKKYSVAFRWARASDKSWFFWAIREWI
jgi:hypothetical protein